MSSAPVSAAVRGLERHTLASIPTKLGKLVYLASTRDYDTGQYHHDGLAQTYTIDVAQRALQRCHESVFRALAEGSLQTLVEEIRAYLIARQEDAPQVLDAWRGLEPYRMLVPMGCDPRVKDLFLTNFSAALAVVRSKDPPHDLLTEPPQR
jgi:hypothetical protein